MKKIYLLGVIIFSSINLLAQELPYAWNFTTQPISPALNSNYNVTGSTIDNSGNLYVIGYFSGTLDFDPSPGTSNLTSSGGTQDIFFAKYSSQGLLIGTPKRLGTGGVETSGNIIYDNGTGSIYLTGSFTSTADFNPSVTVTNLTSAGGTDAFIARYDTDGNYVGAYSIGNTGADAGTFVRVYGGDVYLAGNFTGTVDFDPTGGVSNLTSSGGTDIFFARYTAAASLVWAKSIGSATGSDTPGAFRIADNFLYYSQNINNLPFDFDPGAGNTNTTSVNGTVDFAFAKYDSNGNMIWVNTIGGPGTQFGSIMALDGSHIYVSGGFEQTVDLDPGLAVSNATSTNGLDAFVCKLSTSGDLQWSRTWSSPGNTNATVQQIQTNGDILVTGVFEGSIDLDPTGGVFNKTSNGLSDGFFVRMNAAGVFMDGFSIGGPNADPAPGALSDVGLTKIYMSAYYTTVVDFDPTTDVNGVTSLIGGTGLSQYLASSYSLLATVPASQPTTLGFNTPTADSFNFSFTPATGNPDGYLVVRRPGASSTGIPKDGKMYSPGDPVGDGIVVQSSALTNGSSILMAANTIYHFDVFSFNGSGDATNYFPTTPLEGSFSTSVIGYDRASDSVTLRNLYTALTAGGAWTTSTNWMGPGPINSWFGVTAPVNAGGRVTALNLPGNSLNSQIPPSIGNLTGLQTLSLANNFITGPIPAELGNLALLTSLNFYNNQLTGNIPATLGNLTSLTFLSLGVNKLSGTIPTSLGSLTALQQLHLDANSLSGSIPTQLGNLSNLVQLRLSQNQLSGNIPLELGGLTNLTNLELDRNQLTGSIPTELGNLTSATIFYLYSNKLSGSLPTQLGNLTNVQQLILHTNDFTGPIPTELGSLTNLIDLRISATKISGAIPTSLGSLTNLQILYLGLNKGLTGAVPASFTGLTSLVQLDVQDNQLTDLPDLSGIASLTALTVQNNKFTFEDLEPNITKLGASLNYSPQAAFGTITNMNIVLGQPLNLSFAVGGTSNSYQWKKTGTNVGINSNSYSIPSVVATDGGTYTLTITNSIVTGLTLTSANQIVAIQSEGQFQWVTNAGDLTTEGFDPTSTAGTDQNYSGTWGDFNNDGFDDLFVGNFSIKERSMLYKNNGNGTFSKAPFSSYFFSSGRGLTWADYNNDGFLDAFAPGGNTGAAADSLLNNSFILKNNGNATFSKIVLVNNPASTSGTWADTDNDGDVDLILNGGGSFVSLYRNDGGDIFTYLPAFTTNSNSQWTNVAVDANNDNKPDVYIPDDNQRNFYFGNGNNTFTLNSTTPLTTDVLGFARGASWADIDNDGDFDAYIMGNSVGHRFYINDGAGNFAFQSTLAILGETIFGGRGSSFADVNNDGYVDLLTAQSNITPAGWHLYLNNGNGTFTRQSSQSFKPGSTNLVGASFGDYNNDGFVDIVSASLAADYNGLYRNVGNGNNWLQVKLKGTLSNRSGVGAKVSVKAGGFWRHNQVLTSNGFANQNSLVQQFGLGASTVADSVKIKWPTGATQVLANVPGNQRKLIVETHPDSLALVALYNSTNGPSWTNKTNWLTGPLDTWYGITVWFGTNANKRVRNIALSGNNLNGSLPAQMSELTELEQLDLLNNKLAGTFPIQLTSLTKLKALYLGTNQFTGTLPTQLGNLVNLFGLGLDYNQFTGTIPSEIGNLTNLVYLGLGHNQLSGAVPASFNNLDLLQSLYMPNNNLADLPDLTGMAAITLMMVDVNNLTFEDIFPNKAIPGITYCCQKNISAGAPVNVTLGSPFNLSATVSGAGNKYQWYKSFNPIAGDTTNTHTVAASVSSSAGTYYLQITNPSVPTLTLRTTDFVVTVTSPSAAEESGYTFMKKLGAEALGIKQIVPGGRVSIDNLGNYYFVFAGSGGSEIQKTDPSCNLLYTISSGNNDIGGTDIAIDSQNSVYIPGANYSTLKKYNSSGTLVFETPVYTGSRPFQTIAIDTDGSILTMDIQGGLSGRVKRFDNVTGNLIGQISLTGGPVSNYFSVFDFNVDASGNIYVSDANRIDKFSSAGVFISSFDVSMAGGWGALTFTVASNGHLFVAPWYAGYTPSNKIYHFDNAGVLVGSFGFDFTNIPLSSLTISASNEIIAGSYISVFKFDLNGNFLGFAEPRNANGQFSYAADIATDSKGFRYVVERYNNRIQKLTANGNWVSNIGTQGSGAGQFNRPGSIAIDKSDNLYVTDESNNRVQKFNSSGAHLLTIGSAGTGNGQFTNPVAIVVSKTGDILVADKGNSRVQIFKTDGTFVSAFGTAGTGQSQFTNLRALAVESDGTILAVDGPARLQRFTSQGTFISELDMYGSITTLPHVATDGDGFLYIPTGGVVKKFDKNGGHVTDIGIQGTNEDGVLRSVSISSNIAGDTLWIADEMTTNRMSIFTSNFRKASASDSLALVDLYNSTNGAGWTTKTNWLTGAVNTWYGVTMSGGKIRKLDLQNNNLVGPLPASLTSLDNLLTLNLMNNKLTGTLPDWNVASSLLDVDLSQNLFTGAALTLPAQTEKLDLSDNQLTDVATLPPFIIGADISNNKLTQLGNLPPAYPNLDTLFVQNNKLTFEDLEPNISIPAFSYVPQDTVSTYETYLKQLGESQTFTSAIGGTANLYQWKKNGTDLAGATTTDLPLTNIAFSDDATYSFTSTNSIVPGLTLSSAKKILRVSSLKRDSIALRTMYNTTDGPNWTNKTNWLTTPLGTGNWFGITIANNRVTQVNLPNNNLKGPIAAIVADIQNLVSLNLSNNKITALPDLTSYPSISTLNVSNNKLDFASLEKNAIILGINYANQADLGTLLDTLVNVGEPMKFKLNTGGTTNTYQWKRNGQAVSGATANTYELTAIGRSNMGDYICEVTNPSVPGLTLKSTLQRAKAVANISGKLQVDANTPVSKGKMTLLKINPAGIAFDSVQVKSLNTDGTFNLQKVVLDDYILLGQADSVLYKKYFPTYFDGSVYWEEADTIKLNENRSDIIYSIVALPTDKPKGVGELSGIFETELPGGRMENRGRVAGASATVRRQQATGRPERFGRTMASDIIVAFTYTNDQGEFAFENLEEGPYLLNLQYPGVPMDPKSDIVITIGPKDKRQNIQQVSAVAIGGKIVVKRLVIVGVSEEEQETVQIYPNPTSSDLYINLAEGSGAAEMKLFDRTGREILTQILPEGKTTLDLNHLSAGIYLLKTYRHGKEVSVARVMVE